MTMLPRARLHHLERCVKHRAWDEPDRKRHLLRLWLAAPGARPLPEVYSNRYGKVDIGDRGGIIVPGAMLNAPLEVV